MKIVVDVNGERCETEISPSSSLLDVLRDNLMLTGAKRGCDSGGCGMCTVLLDGAVIYSCMTPAWKANGRSVLTVEGLQKNGGLHPLQKSFHRNSAAQCGFCTSAMLLAGKALLDSNPNPADEKIREAISGILCRCTGYLPYIKSIAEAIPKDDGAAKR